ncbi:hypothetical protein [Cylindrospermum stagnale]|uniref:hypothetical protein n=1 Tax=Cylindrospermum stagnale TaxID=142864 RepID=UPI00059DD04E|nr:hypothetical protein [Cylindrospermum stagnale]
MTTLNLIKFIHDGTGFCNIISAENLFQKNHDSYRLINADVNGSANMIPKVFLNAFAVEAKQLTAALGIQEPLRCFDSQSCSEWRGVA